MEHAPHFLGVIGVINGAEQVGQGAWTRTLSLTPWKPATAQGEIMESVELDLTNYDHISKATPMPT
jgi:hypothetical protein